MIKKLISSYRRILIRDKTNLEFRATENLKVCMVVWNTFETDARVMKEAKSLIEYGKEVTVIAVHDQKKTLRYEEKEGVVIKRVDRSLRKKTPKTTNRAIPKNDSNTTIDKDNQKKDRTVIRSFKNLLKIFPKIIVNVRFFMYAFKEDAGVYHTHDLNTLIPSFFAARLRGAKIIYDAHEISTDRAGWKNKTFWKTIEGILIKKADVVITTNKTRADFFAQQYNVNSPFVIRNVPPYEEVKHSNKIREAFNISNSIPIILYQGGIQKERGLENIIKSIPYVSAGAFVFIGNGALKLTLLKLVKELGITDRTFFLDAVPNTELLSYTSSADIGLQLLQNTCFNHFSATSNKLHEYLMAELPIICSDLPEMKKVIETTKSGLLVNPENCKIIAEKINLLVANKQLREELKKNSKKMKRDYCWELEEVQLLKIYNIMK